MLKILTQYGPFCGGHRFVLILATMQKTGVKIMNTTYKLMNDFIQCMYLVTSLALSEGTITTVYLQCISSHYHNGWY